MHTITLTHGDVMRLYLAIRAAGEATASVRFTYALGRTRRALLPIVETVEAAQTATHERYLDLARDHAERDDRGEPISVEEDGRQGYRIDPARREAFQAAVDTLNVELRALMATDTECQVHRVAIDAVPELTGATVDALWPMLDGGADG